MKPRSKHERTKKVESLAQSVKGVGDKRINIIVTAKEHKALKMKAIEQDMTITDLMKKAVNEYMSIDIFE